MMATLPIPRTGRPTIAGPRQLASETIFVACDWLGGLADWAEGRALTAPFLVGASLPLALCGAAWFSGGTGLRGGTGLDLLGGVLALCGWLLARAIAVSLGRGGRDFAWVFAVGSAAGECAIYGGIAAGAQPGWRPGAWPLAVTTIISIALADMLIACGGAAAGERVLVAPAGLRVALAGMALVLGGPLAALACALGAAVVSIGVAGWRLGAALLARQDLLAVRDLLAKRDLLAGPNLAVACRDDGALARWAGLLVRGSIMPLPPICAGVCAVTLLAVLGLGGLPEVVALAPLMALLLATPGSAHPHLGRADWLAPVLLAFGQFVYLAALGFGRHVPGPLVFALCALSATWYAGLATLSQAPAAGPGDVLSSTGRPLGGLGWESRMFIVTFAAIEGIASVGYLGLSVYLGVLICRKVATCYLTPARDGHF
jgi:hypothetical protein